MRCNEFDAHIDEMLSGILHPDANQHMRQCERCTSHYRARAGVQNGLRNLALVSVPGPSPAADRAVMDAYRRLQQRRTALPQSSTQPQSVQQAAARVLTFPGHQPAPVRSSRHRNSRNWWGGASAAAVALAVLGMGVHLHHGVPMVSAPTVASAPAASAPQSGITSAAVERTVATAKLASRHSGSQPGSQLLLRTLPAGSQPPAEVASASWRSQSVEVAKAAPRTQLPGVQAPAGVSPLIHLASAGETANVAQSVAQNLAQNVAQRAAQNVAQSASSTWPGYSNLMYCDPVVCSGPMQVVHIKVPVDQVKPNVGQSVGNSFVNADVVVGPDGVARAIRVAN